MVVTSGKDRVFCSGANIYMLGRSTHAFKVNFCKYTNETRLSLEDASAALRPASSLAAVNGACAGRRLRAGARLRRDPARRRRLVGGQPARGAAARRAAGHRRPHARRRQAQGAARPRRRVLHPRRGREGQARGGVAAGGRDGRRSRSFAARVPERAQALADAARAKREGPGVALAPLAGHVHATTGVEHRYVTRRDRRRARAWRTLTVRGPGGGRAGRRPRPCASAGSELWALRAFRELDDALLDLRFNRPEIGVVVLQTRGRRRARARRRRGARRGERDDWFVREVLLHMKRVLKRLDLTARSFFAVIDPGSCFAGSLFELALAADRSYMLAADDGPDGRALGAEHGRAADVERADAPGHALPRRRRRSRARHGRAATTRRRRWTAGLVTFAPDDIDWEDEVRLAIEERASLSPDALTGMEANLRFAGPETMETKIFGRLSAWQNWIFQRPNAVGETRRAHAVRQARAAAVRLDADLGRKGRKAMSSVDLNAKIPNNVDLVAGQAPAARARAVAAQLPRVVEGDGPHRLPGRRTSTCAPRSASTPRAGRTSTT